MFNHIHGTYKLYSEQGLMIKNDHSDSVIAYYTIWYAIHSIQTYYHRYFTSRDIESCITFYLQLKIMIATSVSDEIKVQYYFIQDSMLLFMHALIVKYIWPLPTFHLYKHFHGYRDL